MFLHLCRKRGEVAIDCHFFGVYRGLERGSAKRSVEHCNYKSPFNRNQAISLNVFLNEICHVPKETVRTYTIYRSIYWGELFI